MLLCSRRVKKNMVKSSQIRIGRRNENATQWAVVAQAAVAAAVAAAAVAAQAVAAAAAAVAVAAQAVAAVTVTAAAKMKKYLKESFHEIK